MKYVNSIGVKVEEYLLDNILKAEPVNTAPMRKNMPVRFPEPESELSIRTINITPNTDKIINAHCMKEGISFKKYTDIIETTIGISAIIMPACEVDEYFIP